MDGEKTTITIRVTKKFHEKIKQLAVDKETTIKGLFVACLQKLLEEEEAKASRK
jgi:predicted DNA-binding antitoxin AbrB/MazE fold protein